MCKRILRTKSHYQCGQPPTKHNYNYGQHIMPVLRFRSNSVFSSHILIHIHKTHIYEFTIYQCINNQSQKIYERRFDLESIIKTLLKKKCH